MPSHDPLLWTGAILAGGAARRYGGRDKSALVVDGETILIRQLAAIRQVAAARLIVSNDPIQHAPPDVDIVGDLVRGKGALGGVFTALSHARTPWTLVVACDMPFVSASFLEHVCGIAERAGADAVVPRSADRAQPLCAAYSRSAIEIIRVHVDRDALKMTDVLSRLRVRELSPAEIAPFDEGNRLFFNINSPEDYRRALVLVKVQQ